MIAVPGICLQLPQHFRVAVATMKSLGSAKPPMYLSCLRCRPLTLCFADICRGIRGARSSFRGGNFFFKCQQVADSKISWTIGGPVLTDRVSAAARHLFEVLAPGRSGRT